MSVFLHRAVELPGKASSRPFELSLSGSAKAGMVRDVVAIVSHHTNPRHEKSLCDAKRRTKLIC
jgi:hypothetical protein